MKIDEIRRALADYMCAEGCSCCRNEDAYEKARNELAKLLGVRKNCGLCATADGGDANG